MSLHAAVIQKILNAGAHISGRTTAHHFKIYSEGTRNARSIIDADKTLICLRNACDFISQLARINGRFIFVNNNPIFDEIINQMTKTANIKNDTTWRLGGFLTNNLSKKKFKGRNKKLNLNAIVPPDCIVVLDTERKTSVIREAYKLQIPIVGLVDSSIPWETYNKITYPVPANDSAEFVYLFCNLITKTILKEREGMVDEEVDELRFEVEGKKDETVNNQTCVVLPYEELPDISEDISESKQLLDKLVVLKYNGKLGTDIGFNGAKCTMEIRENMTCLDLIVNNIEALNAKYGCNIPVLLVNAVNTHDSVSKVLEKHGNKNIHSIIQSQTPRESTSVFSPESAKQQDEEDEVNSFNLAEVFLPLMKSGKLDILASQGKEYILMLSSDNIAHVVDPNILNHMVQNNIEYCPEVMPNYDYDSEGEEDTKTPTPTAKEQWELVDTMWMNINSIVSLVGQRAALEENVTMSELFNKFALSVSRSRYCPVESTNELFLLQSDLYKITDGTLMRQESEDPVDPFVTFGPEFDRVDEYRMRFKSIPSVVELTRLEVTGDVWFGANITLKGDVEIEADDGEKIVIPDNTVLQDTVILSQKDVEKATSKKEAL